MNEQEKMALLINLQANAILNLVAMLFERADDLTEEELRYLSFMKSGAYKALGEDQS